LYGNPTKTCVAKAMYGLRFSRVLRSSDVGV